MTTFYVNSSQIDNNKIIVFGEDLHHIKDVLRLKKGEELDFCDENHSRYKTILGSYVDDRAVFDIIFRPDDDTELPVNITLFQGIPKLDRFEFIIQKNTELRGQNICTCPNGALYCKARRTIFCKKGRKV